MKKLITTFLASIILFGGCQLLSSDNKSSPEIKIQPASIIAGQEFVVTISNSEEFIMPYCGGIIYEVEKFESGNWEVFDSHIGFCNHMMKPETSISKSTSINLTIGEEGVYRFVSSFKFNSDDDMEPLYSDKFEVKSEE